MPTDITFDLEFGSMYIRAITARGQYFIETELHYKTTYPTANRVNYWQAKDAGLQICFSDADVRNHLNN